MSNTPTITTYSDVSGSLAASEVFEGEARPMTVGFSDPGSGAPPGRYASGVTVTAQPAQACDIDLQESSDHDGADWVTLATLTPSAAELVSVSALVSRHWVRVVVTNGATAQGAVTVTSDFVE